MAVGKPCPGLNKGGCGAPIEDGGGYCREHRREYHRNRYRTSRQLSQQPYNTRDHTRISAPKCDCCGNHNDNRDMIAIPTQNSQTQPAQPARDQEPSSVGLCDHCVYLMLHVHNNLSIHRLRMILAYHAQHPDVIKGIMDPSLHHLQQRSPYKESAEEYAEAAVGLRPLNTTHTAHLSPSVTGIEWATAKIATNDRSAELLAWWHNATPEQITALTFEERQYMRQIDRDDQEAKRSTLQSETLTDNEPLTPQTDPEIKATLVDEDAAALAILRNYEFVPAGPPTSVADYKMFDDED